MVLLRGGLRRGKEGRVLRDLSIATISDFQNLTLDPHCLLKASV